jgi:hypothetical protein
MSDAEIEEFKNSEKTKVPFKGSTKLQVQGSIPVKEQVKGSNSTKTLVKGSIPRKEHVYDSTLEETKGSYEILSSILERIHKELKGQGLTTVEAGEEISIPK